MLNSVLRSNRILRVWMYYRLSRDEDVELNSLNNQRGILLDYINDNGYELVGESFDDNVSGMHFDREGIEQLKKVVENGQIDAVVVKDLSRLGRHRTLTAVFIDYLKQHNVRVLSVTENIDTSDENDDLLVGFKGIVNDLYAKDISKKIRAGYLQKQKSGIVITTPMGYRKDKNTDEILVVAEEAEIIRDIYEMYLSGFGFSSIAIKLNEEGIRSPQYYQNTRYNKKDPITRPDICKKYLWTGTTVKRILENEFYKGTLVCHKSYTSKINHIRLMLSEDECFVHEGFVPPIISKEMWDEVQVIIKKKAEGRVRASKNSPCHRYTGLIVCGDCGCVFVCKTRKWKNKPDRMEYNCNGYHRYGKNHCSAHRIDEEVLDHLIYAELIRIKEIATTRYKSIDDDLKKWLKNEGVAVSRLEKLRILISKQRNDLKALLLERARDISHAFLYDEMITECESNISKMENEIKSIENYSHTVKNRKKQIKSSVELIQKIINEGAISDANLRMLVNKIIISEHGEQLDITIRLNASFTDVLIESDEDLDYLEQIHEVHKVHGNSKK